jgi:hypothetical protein
MTNRPIDGTLGAWNLGELQTFKVILDTLKHDGYSIENALEHIDFLKEVNRAPREIRICPQCEEHWLTLFMVNHAPGHMVGGDWQSQWYCEMCFYDEYSVLPLIEEFEKAIGENKNAKESDKRGIKETGKEETSEKESTKEEETKEETE